MVLVKMDRPRTFKFGMRGISFIEKKTGKPISKIDYENPTMEEVAIMVQGGLIHEDKEFALKTIEEVMDIVDGNDNLPEVLDAMTKAMEEMQGQKSKK